MMRFTVVCDYDGGTYVSQLEGLEGVDIARQWSAMIRSERPIPRVSSHIANRVVKNLECGFLPTTLDGLTGVWQMSGEVGKGFYTTTLVQCG